MRKIIKTYIQRKEELRRSLHRLEGAIGRFQETSELAELGTVAIELRGLVCGRNPLLITVAKEIDFPLELYTISEEKWNQIFGYIHSRRQSEYIVVPLLNFVSSKPNNILSRKMDITSWLDIPFIEVNTKEYPTKAIINDVANTIGPAHYSPEMSLPLSIMDTLQIGKAPSQYKVMLDFSRVMIELGNVVLESCP